MDSIQILGGLRYHATRKLALVYSHAPEQGPHKPLSYSVATRETPVVTRLPDGVETKNTAKVGDLIFTGIGGERYVIRAAKVPSLYVGDIGGPLSVIPTTRMVARYTGEQDHHLQGSVGRGHGPQERRLCREGAGRQGALQDRTGRV